MCLVLFACWVFGGFFGGFFVCWFSFFLFVWGVVLGVFDFVAVFRCSLVDVMGFFI